MLLRLYIGEEDAWLGEPLSRAVVRKAHERGLAVAAVRRGIMGYGAGHQLRTDALADVPAHMPVVVEIAGSSDKVLALLPVLGEMVAEGLIVVEPVTIRQPPEV